MANASDGQPEWASSPYGVMRLGKDAPYPVLQMNPLMAEMMEISETSAGVPSDAALQPALMYLLPPQERALFAANAAEALAGEKAQGGEWTIQCPSGREKRLMGWLFPEETAAGRCLRFMAVEVTRRHQQMQQAMASGQLSALTSAYDLMLECDYQRRSICCLYARGGYPGFPETGVSLHLEDASEYLLRSMVIPADQPRMREWMEQVQPFASEQTARSAEFRIQSPEGEVTDWLGVMIPVRRGVYWVCLRRQGMEEKYETLLKENAMLRMINQQMQLVVNHFTDGVLAFDLQGDLVRPSYASEGIASFFGYTHGEWMEQMRIFQPVRDFVKRSHLPYDTFKAFLDKGEGTFDYMDPSTGARRIMRAVRMMDTYGDGSHGCVILYDVTNGSAALGGGAAAASQGRVFIRTFGYFDVFVGEKPMAFRNEKAKELLALLVDRRGGWVTSSEAISYLWEDEPANPVILARYRKVALRLKNALEEYGIESTVESVDGKRRIVMERVRCDLYEHLAGQDGGNHPFSGAYMTNYSWGEATLSALLGDTMDMDTARS